MVELSPDEWMVQLLNFVNFILGWVIFGFALNGRSKFSTVASERAHGAHTLESDLEGVVVTIAVLSVLVSLVTAYVSYFLHMYVRRHLDTTSMHYRQTDAAQESTWMKVAEITIVALSFIAAWVMTGLAIPTYIATDSIALIPGVFNQENKDDTRQVFLTIMWCSIVLAVTKTINLIVSHVWVVEARKKMS